MISEVFGQMKEWMVACGISKILFINWCITFSKRTNMNVILSADYMTCLTYAAKKEIHNWKNIPNQPIPIEVIPCSADMELFNPE